MIKINLLKGMEVNLSVPQAGESSRSIDIAGLGSAGSPQKVDVAIKVILAFSPILLIIGYEQINLASLGSERQKAQQELESLSKQQTELKTEIAAVKKFREEEEKLNRQIDTIKSLSSERLVNIKALDQIRNTIPSMAWLNKFSIQNQKVEIVGYAVADANVYEFVKALQNSIFFSDVKMNGIKNKNEADGTYKEFSITCRMENK